MSSLSARRDIWIRETRDKVKERHFKNFKQENCEIFLKEEYVQSEWHYKYRAKYEIEKFLDNQKKSMDRVLIIGEINHTKVLYERLHDFPSLNVIGFSNYDSENSIDPLSKIYVSYNLTDLNQKDWDIIFISSHEKQEKIYLELKAKGIPDAKIFVPYDNAGDTLENRLAYLPIYNPV